MVTFHLPHNNLAGMRFFYRPLIEVPFSYRVLINPAFQSRYTGWVQEARHALHGLELPYLEALVPPRGYSPDFLTPQPTKSHRTLDQGIDEMLATPNDLISQHMATHIMHQGSTPLRDFFLVHPREAVESLAEEIRIYWRRVIEPYWDRINAILEADVLYKGRILALDGPESLFPDLHPAVRYASDEVTISPQSQLVRPDIQFQTGGAGIQLVPSLFGGCGLAYQFNADCSLMLVYRTRGTGLWYEKPPDPGHSLKMAVGSGRAQVLELLTDPTTTGELAHRLHYTAGAVSQQLANLREAGLIESERRGKRVFHRLTTRGESLLALFDTA